MLSDPNKGNQCDLSIYLMSSRYAEVVRFPITWRKLKEIKRKICLFLLICHVTCIRWINFHKGSMRGVFRWYANFPEVKRYQNHKQWNARRLKCYSIVKCFGEFRNSKIWPNLYAMFFFFINRQSESTAKALHVYRLLASQIY